MAETDNVSEKILEDAEKEKNKIIAEAKQKANQVVGEAKRKKEERLTEAKKQAERKYKQAYELEMVKAKSETRQKLLLSKLKLVDETIDKAKQQIYEYKKEDYIKFLKKALKDLDIKQGEYIIGKDEKDLDGRTISSLSKQLKLKKSGQDPDFSRGLKIVSSNKEYLLSPETIIDSQIEDIKMETANFLFGEEK